MSFRSHGNYCGPGWSGGRWRNSVISNIDSVSELDEACREHDAEYNIGDDLLTADVNFAKRALDTHTVGGFAHAVGLSAQAFLRGTGLMGCTVETPVGDRVCLVETSKPHGNLRGTEYDADGVYRYDPPTKPPLTEEEAMEQYGFYRYPPPEKPLKDSEEIYDPSSYGTTGPYVGTYPYTPVTNTPTDPPVSLEPSVTYGPVVDNIPRSPPIMIPIPNGRNPPVSDILPQYQLNFANFDLPPWPRNRSIRYVGPLRRRRRYNKRRLQSAQH